jgi:hypothetical protein
MKIFKPFLLYTIIAVSSALYAQSSVVVCPPSNFTATAAIGSAHLSWQNPGTYYGTQEISAGDTSYFTGTVDNIAGELTEHSRIRSVYEEVGWATFDISTLPPGQEPISVEFNFYVYETNWPYWSVTPVSSNPITADPQALYQDIIEGYSSFGVSDYGTFEEVASFSAGSYSYPLIGSVLDDIASAADTSSWFTIGIVDYDFVSTGEYYISLHGWSELYPPTLTVTYGDGQRFVTPAVPAPGVSSADVAEYKNNVLNGEQEEHEAQKHEVNIELNQRTEDDCSSAWKYYVFMDGDTIAYTGNRELTVNNLTIGQEYCFYATAEFREFDSLGVLVETSYSAPSDTSCTSPVQFLLCPPEEFSSIHTYSTIELLWSAAFSGGHVEQWGASWSMIPLADYIGVKAIAAGEQHLAYLHSDSTVSIHPVGGWLQPGPAINHDVVQVAAGLNFTIALRADGTVFGYGQSADGQGDPPDGLDSVVAISAGWRHSLALLEDSTVVAWGYNYNGQIDVPDTLEGVVAVSAGYVHSLVLLSDGTVVEWGASGWGEEQDSIGNSLTNVVAISAGRDHNLALLADGTAAVWGSNISGNNLAPPEDLEGVVHIAAGYYHNVALKNDGTVVAWGQNDYEQTAPQPFDDVLRVDAGYNYNVALRADVGADCGGFLGYTILQDGDSIATTQERGYSIVDAEWDQEYCYNVLSRYSQGNSSLSDTICTSLITPGFCPPNYFIADSDYDNVYLDWAASEGDFCGTFLGYTVYQDDVPIDTLLSSAYEISNLSYDTDYCFYITALYLEGESVPTDTICISRVTPQLCLPDSVGVEPGDNEVLVSWEAPYSALTSPGLEINDKRLIEAEMSRSEITSQDNIDDNCGSFLGYHIYVNGDSAAFVADSATHVIVTGLDNGEEQCITMSTVYVQGESPQSDAICVIPYAVSRDHNTEILKTTITNEGNIGYTNARTSPDSLEIDSVGLGFVYVNNNYLYEAGLMLGTGVDHISDCIRNDTDGWTQDDDFVETEGTYLHVDTSHSLVNEVGVVSLRDSNAENPLGVRVEQRSYADGSFELRNGTIFHYTIVNDGNADLTNFYAGLFFDWDIANKDNNSSHYSADYRMVYAQDQEGNPSHFAGLVMLNQGLGMNMRSLNNYSDGIYLYSNEDKWSHMTSGVDEESVFSADVSSYVGVGPVDIAHGDSISFGIATIAASSIYELEYVAGEMHTFWETNFPEELSAQDEAVLPIEFAMHQNYPNPFNPVTSIRYDIPSTSNVRISVYSLLGQKVKTLTNSMHQPGFYSAQWNGTNDMGSAVSSGVYICKINAGNYTSIKKMILMK